MTDNIPSRIESLRMLLADVARTKGLKEQVKKLTILVTEILEGMKELKSGFADLKRDHKDLKRKHEDLKQDHEDLRRKHEELSENLAAEKKTRVAETTQIRKEIDDLKNKFHLRQRRNFCQQYLRAVLADLDFKSEEIDHASTAELWNMVDEERYMTWRAASDSRNQLPTYEQMAKMMAAVHTSKMMELFDELSVTGQNTEKYEPTWDYLADKANWKKWSALVEAKNQQQ